MRRLAASVFALVVLWRAEVVPANPWLSAGDEGLRSDIQRLADARILRGPVMTWPLSWPDIARDVLAAQSTALDDETGLALARVLRLARRASAMGFDGATGSVAAASSVAPIRGFHDDPRAEGELEVQASWLGEYASANLSATLVIDPEDGKESRADGSYIGLNIGNFMVSAGYMERWWGPGWDGSLILSTNARPIPTLTLERNYTDAFKSRWLSWIGPWRASIAVGEAENHDVPVANVKFLAARINFRPRPWLELALSRTAQWCGGDRPCGLDTFRDLLMGRDNSSTQEGRDNEPGNQMAGYDIRLVSPWRKLPVAVYSQLIGEDEAGGLPSKFIGLFGMEWWGHTQYGDWRLRSEFADTACSFSREDPEFGCAYRNSIYPQGYSYRGRGLGHSIDNDSRMYTVGAIWTRPEGDVGSLRLNKIEINRDGGGHPLSGTPQNVNNVELRYFRGFSVGRLGVGVGYEERGLREHSASPFNGFIRWQQGF